MTHLVPVWSALVLALAVSSGPTLIVTRCYLRAYGSPAIARRWAVPVARGVCLGMVAAILLAGQYGGILALVCLLFLLASIDWFWRWLPIEWTGAVIALASVSALTNTAPLTAIAGMAVPALTLLALRQAYLSLRGVAAMGLGDIWLMVGLGGYLSVTQSFLLIGIAALLGLAEVAIRNYRHPDATQPVGVSYGTHLCVVFLGISIFAEVW